MVKPDSTPENIHLNDPDDLESIIGSPPGWLLNWGMIVLFLLFVLLFCLSAFIRYPDIVEARAVLTTEHPPLRIMAGASGEIEQLLVKNGQPVKAGEVLARLKNAAVAEDVLLLESILLNWVVPDASISDAPSLPFGLRLGEMNADYTRLTEQLGDLHRFQKLETNSLKISNLRRQIAGISNLNGSTGSQIRLLETETALARKNFERDSFLFFEKAALSRLEMEQSQAAFLRKNRELELLRSDLTLNELKTRQLEVQILDLQQFQSDNLNLHLRTLRQTAGDLQGRIAAWKQAFLLLAPIAGTVDLSPTRSEHQFVRVGEELLRLVVTTKDAGRLTCRAIVPAKGIGKVRPGLTARIRLDAFPYPQYGSLVGVVGNIALAPVEAGYEIEILLGDSLKTDVGKWLPFRQEMQGTVRIVAEKTSLLNRVLYRLMS